MWSPKTLIRLLAVMGLAGLTAGCFQPMYGERAVLGSSAPGIIEKMNAVEVAPIDAPNGTRLSRVGVEVRNGLIFDMTGGSGGAPQGYRLDVKLSSSQLQVIVDINTARPDIQNYGIDASYTLIDLATQKPVVKGQTFARVSYNIPGQQQRFAGDRGLRDAENRAAKVIADNIRNRLASYFTAGT
jgi:LPS-assembly lipoprotein